MKIKTLIAALLLAIPTCAAAAANMSDEDLAKTLQNPVASLINVPLQNNYNWDVGPEHDGTVYTMRLQPVIPLPFNDDFNLVSRTIIAYVNQHNIIGRTSQSGVSDLQQSFFFTPKTPEHGIIWGVGPIFYIPTASESLLGAEKWGAGPTAVALTQRGPWTIGLLMNHIWSFAGHKDRSDLSQTYIKPFGAYTLRGGLTLNATLESTYDWKQSKWTALPLELGVSNLFTVLKQKVNLSGMLTYDSQLLGSNKLGVRLTVTLLFPEHTAKKK